MFLISTIFNKTIGYIVVGLSFLGLFQYLKFFYRQQGKEEARNEAEQILFSKIEKGLENEEDINHLDDDGIDELLDAIGADFKR